LSVAMRLNRDFHGTAVEQCGQNLRQLGERGAPLDEA